MFYHNIIIYCFILLQYAILFICDVEGRQLLQIEDLSIQFWQIKLLCYFREKLLKKSLCLLVLLINIDIVLVNL